MADINDINAVNIEAQGAGDIRFDPDDSAPDYVGLNLKNSALTSSEDWLVYKFNYSGSNVTRIQKARGSWDNRASLF